MTVASRMTAGAVTVGGHARLQQLIDLVEGRRVTGVAVVDDFGRLLGAIDTADHPDLFGPAGGPRIAGTPRQRRRRDRQCRAVAGDLMAAAEPVPWTWPVARALQALTAAGTDVAYVVDDLGCVRGTITIRQCRTAPAARTALKEAGRDQVRV
ncbi:CBS domain-containing protein [Dactylosporangium sp. NBC_01737]|uniref:CBS domain-containing protein n=1 Tax=Dactylosporangium sp. NBC_01737 TaxID=2975959 RepID=UPI002E0D4268|nr:CBS domain-containing protein [Dactylosporangium sp. NBC_01737]